MSSERMPSFLFYPDEWLTDPALRSVSVAARGLWIDLLCILHKSELSDYEGRYSNDEAALISRLTLIPKQKVIDLLKELAESYVYEITHPDYPPEMRGSYDFLHSPRISREQQIHSLLTQAVEGTQEIPKVKEGSNSTDNPPDPIRSDENTFDSDARTLLESWNALDIESDLQTIRQSLQEGFSVEQIAKVMGQSAQIFKRKKGTFTLAHEWTLGTYLKKNLRAAHNE